MRIHIMTGTRTDSPTYSLIEVLLGPSIYPTLPATRCHAPTTVPLVDRVTWITDAAMRECASRQSDWERELGRWRA
ncbi:MAG TPA: hypothetical protein VN861_03040 [Candidatus Acidoferrales bacterium]|nr:hypothetical protein [Candidatus Acidoferrales bacterium]